MVNDIDGHVISGKVERVEEVNRCSPSLSRLLFPPLLLVWWFLSRRDKFESNDEACPADPCHVVVYCLQLRRGF